MKPYHSFPKRFFFNGYSLVWKERSFDKGEFEGVGEGRIKSSSSFPSIPAFLIGNWLGLWDEMTDGGNGEAASAG